MIVLLERFRRFRWPLSIAVLLVALPTRLGHALAEPTLSGGWAAGALMSSWNIGDWGEACGPKPGGAGASSGTVSIIQRGGELLITGTGRNFSTTECWEQFPGLKRISHSGGKRSWKTVCRTAPGDARQATVVTKVTASDTYITLDETGQYQFVISGQNCTASARRSRSFRLIQREGEAPLAPSATASAAPAKQPSSEHARQPGRCDNPGSPAKLQVHPARKLMRPGEQFTFRAAVLDASGCHLALSPLFRLEDEGAPATLSGLGKIHVAESARESEIALVATLASRSVRVLVEVASAERYEALLQSRGFNASGESKDAAVTAIASASIGTRSAVSQDRAQRHRATFVAVVGAAALLLGIVGLILVARGRQRRREQSAGLHVERLQVRDARPAEPAPVTMVCPTCRDEHPPYAQFCPRDGNRLVPLNAGAEGRAPSGGVCPVCGQGFDPGVTSCPKHDEELVPPAVYGAQFAAATELAKICPICGTQYPGDGRFCGRDGAALVPMN